MRGCQCHVWQSKHGRISEAKYQRSDQDMRQGTFNHFVGSLMSRQVIYAYGAADGITTTLWVGLGWLGIVGDISTIPAAVGHFVEIYITGLLPVFVPPYNLSSIVFILSNLFLTVFVLSWWSAKYGWSQ